MIVWNDKKIIMVTKDAAEVMGVRKMCGLGEAIYEQGIEQGELKMLVSLVKDGLLNLSDVSQKINMTEPELFTTYGT